MSPERAEAFNKVMFEFCDAVNRGDAEEGRRLAEALVAIDREHAGMLATGLEISLLNTTHEVPR